MNPVLMVVVIHGSKSRVDAVGRGDVPRRVLGVREQSGEDEVHGGVSP